MSQTRSLNQLDLKLPVVVGRKNGDLEIGFKGPFKAFTTLAEVAMFGERQIFGPVCQFLMPFIDEEINAVAC